MDKRVESYVMALERLGRMEATRLIRDPLALERLARSLSPLDGGAQALEAGAKLDAMLAPELLAAEILHQSEPAFPAVNPARAVVLGEEFETGQPVAVDLSVLNRHLLIVGASGSGKTTCIFALIKELLRHRISVVFSDHKAEGRRIPGAMVFRPDQETWNMLEPVGHPESYCLAWASEFGRAFGLRPETWTELAELLSRLQ